MQQLQKIDSAILAGWAFQAGNLGLFAIGVYKAILVWHGNWTFLGIETWLGILFVCVFPALVWLATSEMLRRRGDDPKWFAVSCVMCVFAMCLTNYPELKTFDFSKALSFSSPAMATAFGTLLFSLSYGIFGTFSEFLTHKYGEARNNIARWTLGHPRLLTGLLASVSMIPIIRDTIVEKNLAMAGVITSFLVGEVLIAMSSPDAQKLALVPEPELLVAA
jgi:hypothetical protein